MSTPRSRATSNGNGVAGKAAAAEDYPASLDEMDHVVNSSAVKSTNGRSGSTSTSTPSPSSSAATPLPNAPPFVESLSDTPNGEATDWSKSYHGLSSAPFPAEAAEILLAPLDPEDIEMKPGTFILSIL